MIGISSVDRSPTESCLGTSTSAVSADPPNTPQVDVAHDVPRDPGRRRDALSGLELDLVALPVAEAEGVRLESLVLGDRQDGASSRVPR